MMNRMNREIWKKMVLALFLPLMLGLMCGPASAFAARDRDKDDDKRPDRLLTMAAEYPGVVIPPDEDVSMDLIFHNKGKSDENAEVWIAEQPEKWKVRIKTYQYSVSALHIPSGDDKTLTFETEPPKEVKPGKYTFRIQAKTPDKKFEMDQTVTVTIREKDEGDEEAKGVKLTTSYPMLRGPSDGEFEFSLEIESELDKDAVFNLFAEGPDEWDVNFKPAYESKFISSVRLKADESKTVAVQVKPTANAKEGEYPVNVRVTSGDAKAEAKLMVVLTGTYKLEVGTVTGLLSLDARQGKPSNFSFYIKNTGSAANHNVTFMSFKPENWKVEFKPEVLESIPPGELEQVEVILTPNDEALVGDYSVNIKVDGEKVSDDLEFRVTVKASAAWAGIGILIILAVIIGLTVLFRKLGRR